MKSYEEEIKEKTEKGESLPKKIDISMLKYFWQASPLAGTKSDTVPKFLRKIEVLSGFTDNQLRILSKYFHLRTFADDEVVFKQNELGMGFYFVFSGHVDLVVAGQDYHAELDDPENIKTEEYILSLERGDYFGELALLQAYSVRSAMAVAKKSCRLLGLFKPDLEEMIDLHPVIAAKLLQSISMIIANRLFSLTKEVGRLKFRVNQLENKG